MSFKSINIIYWLTFLISIVILPLNFGLGLIAMSIIIVPVLIMHVSNGLKLKKIEKYKIAIFISTFNLLIFSLIRPDGVHAINENGLSSLLDVFHINAGYKREYENYFFIFSFILLLFQLIIELRLRKLVKNHTE
ncbi:hypothetical protein OO013_17205 [Mangrovivirga sp. M17]|uniref:Uncharacterized protein n=1 Tax=Mangrovivirga halotolerans TaxID=2993936 RepID=A0ABT3RVF6_9BACT|nr:hypothetical protein [Mangrovivirga halotolerans]MCX2745623.1 hypothetical protein [Mangrovivirga halotolerans]